MKALFRACYMEGARPSITKLVAVLTAGVCLYRAVVDGTPDWGGMAAFQGAAWGLVQVRKHVDRERAASPGGLS